MTKEDIIRLAVHAGITPWAKKEWSKDQFVQTDEGMDGDATCLIQFAALVAKAERHRICEMLRERHRQEERHNYYGFIANMIEEMP